MTKTRNAWIVVEASDAASASRPEYEATIPGDGKTPASIAEGDGIIVADTTGNVLRVGCVLRVRSDLESTTVHFDRAAEAKGKASLAEIGLTSPASNGAVRIQWDAFEAAALKAFGMAASDVPLIEDQAYVRELLQIAVTDDLLGPANGPYEQIVGMGVRDRYLVGKIAPRRIGSAGGGIEGLEGPLEAEDEEEPDDLDVHTGRHDPGAEFDSTDGHVDAEADTADEIDAASNQSLVPSSIGYTFCVDGDAKAIEVEARWGRYARFHDHDQTKKVNRKIRDPDGNVVDTEQHEVRVRVWQREPCGGRIIVDLTEGPISHRPPDERQSEVRVQGTVRGKNANGDRLVTLFWSTRRKNPKKTRTALGCSSRN